ncbi:MAG: DUF3800 domain-containing protein [Dehalococcoidia bacterium]|jgi:hypothetical protein
MEESKPSIDFFFVDDAKQYKPTRDGMGPLVAVGGILVPGDSVWQVETDINKLCCDTGFPVDEPFKWSPGTDLWMRANLYGKKRREFFLKIIEILDSYDTTAIVVIEDTTSRTATTKVSHEMDATILLLERIHNNLQARKTQGVVLFSCPSGDKQTESVFLGECRNVLSLGTAYLRNKRILLNVLSSPQKFIRLLQVADLITSCTTAHVAGESRYSPPIFESIKKLFASDLSRIGGVGLKIHPDGRHANLYYWLLGDTHFVKHYSGVPLPIRSLPYFSDSCVK